MSYFDERADVELTNCELVKKASEFIVATGGRSRNTDYLHLIEERVRSGRILYWRIVYDEMITHEVYEHICTVLALPNSTVVHLKDTAYGNMFITDGGLALALPVPGHGELKGISIPNATYAQRMYNNYMMIVFSKGKRITNIEEFHLLCNVFCSKNAQLDTLANFR